MNSTAGGTSRALSLRETPAGANGVSCPPLGCDRVFLHITGKQVHHVGHGEQFEKSQGWKAKLDISANKDEVEIVRGRG